MPVDFLVFQSIVLEQVLIQIFGYGVHFVVMAYYKGDKQVKHGWNVKDLFPELVEHPAEANLFQTKRAKMRHIMKKLFSS